MGAIGAGLAVWAAWQALIVLLKDDNRVAREINSGCIWGIGLFAVLTTCALIDAL